MNAELEVRSMNSCVWPYNLWSDIIDSGRFAAKAEDGSDLEYVLYWPNLEAVLSSALDERHQRVLRMRYEQNLSYRAIGEELGVGPERIRQLIVHSLRKLREPRNFFRLNATPERDVIKLSMELRDMTEKYNSLKVQVDNLVDEIEARKAKIRAELPLDSPIASLELSMRSFNCLRANNIETVGDLVACKESTLESFSKLGKISIADIKSALERYEYELAPED